MSDEQLEFFEALFETIVLLAALGIFLSQVL